MDESEIQKKIDEMRASHPASFRHPQALEGEMCVGEFIPDDGPELIVARLNELGRYARLGQGSGQSYISRRPLFVKIREQAESELKDAASKV